MNLVYKIQEPVLDVDDASADAAAGEVARRHVTDSGIPLAGSYGPADAEAPGAYPFTRGIEPDGYRRHLWHRDLYAGFGNAEEAGARYRELLDAGASGVNIALDLPTQLGYDSDYPSALAEAGRVGLAVDSVADIFDVFKEIPLREAKIVFTVANGIGPMALSWFMLLGEHQGVGPDEYVIHLQNDPLKEFSGRGAFVFSLDGSLRLACDVVEFAARNNYLHWKPIGICGSQYRWGGGNAVHEIAYAVCSARAYIDELLRRGLSIDSFGPLLEVHLTSDLDILEEVAKFRAARRVWAGMMRDSYGASDPESQKLRVSLYTAGYRLTAQEPLNNAVRVAYQALAAVLGGVQHVGTLSMDEALATPSSQAARLAVQTQNILAYETSLSSVADPLGGSWLVESLTDELERRVREEIDRITSKGGIVESIRAGYVQGIINDAAYRYQEEIETGARVMVGTNRFKLGLKDGDAEDETLSIFRVGQRSADRQVERLRALRARRDQAAVGTALGHLSEAAAGKDNLVEPIKAAFSAYATMGEVCDCLRGSLGSWEDEGTFL